MSLNIYHCRLCLQKNQEPAKTLSRDSKIFALVTNLFPGMDTSVVINSKLCSECFKSVQFSNLVIESVRRNEQKILLNFQNILEKSTCRLCLTNENLEAAVCLIKNTNEEARRIIEMAIIDLDFDKFRIPVMCSSCWQKVKFIYLFKKKFFATEKILKYYCVSNKINYLDRKELEIVSLSYREKLQHFSENLDKQNSVFDRIAGSSCNLNVIKNDVRPPDMGDLNNFPKNEHDFFEEVPIVVNIPKEEYEIDIVEEKLYKINESDENEVMAVDTVSLESLDNIQDIRYRSDIRDDDSENKTTLSIKCEKCSYETREEFNFELHLKAHQSKANILQCSKSYYITTCSNSLKNHLETHKTKPKIFKCQECDYVTEKHSSLVTHMSTHQDKYNFKCSECSYRGKSKVRLAKHMLVHQENYDFSCNRCDYQAKRKGDLTKHMVIHQDDYNFKCPKCSYRGKSKGLLAKHMVIHQENCDFSCDKCNYRAKRKENLTRHMIIHQENYDFSCDKCNYQAKRKENLTRHMVIHQDKYNFKCPKCSYRGKSKTLLAKHIVVHQENYNFSCYKCNYQAKRKANFIKHMVIHQDEYNFKCPKCSYRGKSKDYLSKHMLIHPENENFLDEMVNENSTSYAEALK